MKLKDILRQVKDKELEEYRKKQPELNKHIRIPPLAMTQKLKDIYEV